MSFRSGRAEARPRRPASVIYAGTRDARGDVEVWRRGRGRAERLTPDASQEIWNHDPRGFNWSSGGGGPAQLALAILLDYLRDPRAAVTLHQEFKWRFVRAWARAAGWSISGTQINTWLQSRSPVAQDAAAAAPPPPGAEACGSPPSAPAAGGAPPADPPPEHAEQYARSFLRKLGQDIRAADKRGAAGGKGVGHAK